MTEIERGLALTSRQHPDKARALAAWLDGVLGSDIVFLPIDAEVARLQGRMTADPALRSLWVPDARAKRPAPGHDLSIAATAIVAGATVATANLAHFRRIHERFPLPGLVDPAAAGRGPGDDGTLPHAAVRSPPMARGPHGGTLRAGGGRRPPGGKPTPRTRDRLPVILPSPG